TYVKTERAGFRQPSQIDRRARQFTAARATAIRSLEATFNSSDRSAAQVFAHAGLAALARGGPRPARMPPYRSPHHRPLPVETYMRLAKTFLPLGLARILSRQTTFRTSPVLD